MALNKEGKKKKDFLHGLKGKTATGLGLVLYLISRFVFDQDMFITGILQIAGIILFIGGLYRWNKEIKKEKK